MATHPAATARRLHLRHQRPGRQRHRDLLRPRRLRQGAGGLGVAPVDVVRAYLAAFGTGDPDAVAAWVDDEFWNEHPSSLAVGSRGRAQYRDRLPGFLAEFAGLRYDVEDVVAEGDKVVVAYTMRARWRSEHPITIRGVFRFEVTNGLIVHRVDYWDGNDFLRQSGQA